MTKQIAVLGSSLTAAMMSAVISAGYTPIAVNELPRTFKMKPKRIGNSKAKKGVNSYQKKQRKRKLMRKGK